MKLQYLCHFFFLSKPWSLLNKSFPKLSRYAKPLLILDDVANMHLLLRSKMKTKNKKKRNIIKHFGGSFTHIKESRTPMNCEGKTMLFFCPTRCVRFISSYKGSSNVVFVLKLMKILRKAPFLFYPKFHFRHSYNFEKLQRTFFNRF